jgi:hypothetical protein
MRKLHIWDSNRCASQFWDTNRRLRKNNPPNVGLLISLTLWVFSFFSTMYTCIWHLNEPFCPSVILHGTYRLETDIWRSPNLSSDPTPSRLPAAAIATSPQRSPRLPWTANLPTNWMAARSPEPWRPQPYRHRVGSGQPGPGALAAASQPVQGWRRRRPACLPAKDSRTYERITERHSKDSPSGTARIHVRTSGQGNSKRHGAKYVHSGAKYIEEY